MKNGLILFLIIFPIIVLNDFVFNRENPILSVLEMFLPIVTFVILLKKNLPLFAQEFYFKKIIRFSFISAVFYGVWIGFYQFLVTQYFRPEILVAQLEMIKSSEFFGRSFTEEELIE